ncbi:MAG: energy transducer TonB [Terriglobales bacterium]
MQTRACMRSDFFVRRLLVIVSLLACILLSSVLWAQESASKRRIVNKTNPSYPALARHMGLSGVVRIEALVAPDGTVKAVDVKGGHPVLAQAATNTIRQWKWEPAARESHELVEIHFSSSE